MIRVELQIRARRLIEGRGKVEDFDRLFLDQRESWHGSSRPADPHGTTARTHWKSVSITNFAYLASASRSIRCSRFSWLVFNRYERLPALPRTDMRRLAECDVRVQGRIQCLVVVAKRDAAKDKILSALREY